MVLGDGGEQRRDDIKQEPRQIWLQLHFRLGITKKPSVFGTVGNRENRANRGEADMRFVKGENGNRGRECDICKARPHSGIWPLAYFYFYTCQDPTILNKQICCQSTKCKAIILFCLFKHIQQQRVHWLHQSHIEAKKGRLATQVHANLCPHSVFKQCLPDAFAVIPQLFLCLIQKHSTKVLISTGITLLSGSYLLITYIQIMDTVINFPFNSSLIHTFFSNVSFYDEKL